MIKRLILVVWTALYLSLSAQGQVNKGLQPGSGPTPVPGKRIALVIGNAKYQHGTPLKNPVNDAELMEQTLRELNFEVIIRKNAKQKEMESAMEEFTTKIYKGNYELAMFYYSGHGLEVNGSNYLLPVEANPVWQTDVKYCCVDAMKVLDGMNAAGAVTKLMVLDACRDNPLPRSWTRSTDIGLAALPAPKGSLVGYATAPKSKAWDGNGSNSPYTSALARYLKEPGLDILQIFTKTSAATQDAAEQMGMEQVPYLSSSLRGQLVLVPVQGPRELVVPAPDPDVPEVGGHAPLVGKMILIKGGTFAMGCTGEQEGCESDEKPVHRVTLGDYYLGETEVTQAQWRAVMGNNPSYNTGCDQCPVEGVNWNDIQDFLRRLNERSGSLKYRLPTEAEWEYAARGGKESRGYRYPGSNNMGEVGWYGSNSGSNTHPVKGKHPNELGLYDMSGNVWEWCSDWYGDYSSTAQMNPLGAASGSDRVVRGGSWYDYPPLCRVSNRADDTPDNRVNRLGFRLARTF
ncbi:MAG: SUMF1/EgtB/PvdO family nonheme iron enzyme [Chitinophagales bacterium]|jgi:formylglycine-generating enzyme required for sulfatase activity